MDEAFTAEHMYVLLKELGNRLSSSGIEGEIVVVGGAAMVMAFKSRVSTKDIDGSFAPATEIRQVARQIAEERGIRPDWLNDAVKGFFTSDLPAERRVSVVEFPGLHVMSAPADYVLSMKCLAARVEAGSHDKADAAFLIRHLGLKTVESVQDIVERYCPKESIPAKSMFFIEEAMERAWLPEEKSMDCEESRRPPQARAADLSDPGR